VSLKRSGYTLRIDPTLLSKISYIAGHHCRSLNRELEMLIRAHIDSFEREHGRITLQPDSTCTPE
jgi:hypothetical protein